MLSDILKSIPSSLIFLTAAAMSFPAIAQGVDQNVAAFTTFVERGDYAAANMYISGGFVNKDDIDTTGVFVQSLMKSYSNDLKRNAGNIDALYTYLSSVAPIDFNRAVRCGDDNTGTCSLATNLLTGADRATIDYFLQRGLDLNFKAPGVVPASVPMMMRMGAIYQIDDLNHFVSQGFSLGADRYSVSELSSYQDSFLTNSVYGGSGLDIPIASISGTEINLLDLLVVVLGSKYWKDDIVEANRVGFICEFIAYAAPSFTPSFDYLEYILKVRETFRESHIGKIEKSRSGRGAYEAFPAACVTLVKSMVTSHGNIHHIINAFVSEQQTETANWLMKLRSAAP